ESPRVLQLALHRDVVELAPEESARLGAESRRAGELVEAGVDERAVELLVAVVQERDEVVDAGAKEGVLEIDPADRAVGADHEVSRLVVAVDERARPARDPAGEALRDRVEGRPVGGGQGVPACVEPPLAKMIDLPAKE